ncbi:MULTISPECIES: Mov34/MPN/PAD-1 family protein [unclassified Mesorhizobium]|uniref:Mov34/MPN/PAD-1 family protein n=1 Tax=unclassified Mesorhizobium TaxID=325217 RepID=UPI001FE0BE56|nr:MULTISPECIES: Mov34/MPN/PAD-1 family protein [unclassified Mesorhizobium]
MRYPIGCSGQDLVFTQDVVAHIERHRQLRFWQAEAGGSLFARFSDREVIIEVATGPRKTDCRTRFTYHPDRKAEQREIDEMHPKGLLFVGTWHSHPEPVPTPSTIDLHSLAESFLMSRHHLNAFVLAIIGQRQAPQGLQVVLGDGQNVIPLRPANTSGAAAISKLERDIV